MKKIVPKDLDQIAVLRAAKTYVGKRKAETSVECVYRIVCAYLNEVR